MGSQCTRWSRQPSRLHHLTSLVQLLPGNDGHKSRSIDLLIADEQMLDLVIADKQRLDLVTADEQIRYCGKADFDLLITDEQILILLVADNSRYFIY